MGLLLFLLGLILGGVIISVVHARDPDLYRLGPDEKIVKKPMDGYVFVQVPPEVLRKLVGEVESRRSGTIEARHIYASVKDGKTR